MDNPCDSYAGTYAAEVERSISFAGKQLDFFVQAKVDAMLEIAARHLKDVEALSALDVGCGIGLTDTLLAPRVGSLQGVDISEPLLDEARRRNPGTAYELTDGKRLPYDDGAFDIAFTICVMHHVPPADWVDFMAELRRVTRPGGLVFVFEHNPYNPLTRLAVHRCAFDKGVTLLSRSRAARLIRDAGMRVTEQRDILFFPSNRGELRRLEGRLGMLPLGAQYVVAGQVA
jgi:SAM-dependent methyltransferase